MPANTTATLDVDHALAAVASRPGFPKWREKVKSVHGCAAPIKLRGSSQIRHRHTGEILKHTGGSVWVPCGTRREALCASCAAWYADDAFHLIRAGLDGDATKGITAAVAERPRWFVTLTAPSFGPVHSRYVRGAKAFRPCACGSWHAETDTRLGQAVDLDAYDFEAAVLWQAHAGELWHRFTIAIRRELARIAGCTATALGGLARLSYAKVAEYQRRGLIHFHAAIRLDGPDGASDAPPAWATKETLADAIGRAAAAVAVPTVRRDGTPLTLRFGTQLDLRDITGHTADDTADNASEVRSSALASYVAKYATKSSGATDGTDRRLRSREEIDLRPASEHHRQMMRTAWDLGGLDAYAHLNLRRWAHMLGFRGHFLTKSRLWSTTLGELRAIRARYRLAETLAALEVAESDVIVVNDWEAVAFGHDSEAERELAAAIAETMLQKRRSKPDTRRE
jgi:hypothetical protein